MAYMLFRAVDGYGVEHASMARIRQIRFSSEPILYLHASAAGVTVTLVNPSGFTTVANLMSAANSALGVSGGNSSGWGIRPAHSARRR